LALIAFAFIITGTLVFEAQRLAFALGGVAFLIGSGLVTVPVFIRSASLDVILFLLGNFLVVGYLEERQFFEHIVGRVIDRLGNRPRMLLFGLMVIAAVFSALAGEVAAALVMTGAGMHLAKRHTLNPVPLVMMLVFAINTGSAAGPFGPIGVKIALTAGLTVGDFLRWAAPISFLCLAVVFGIASLVFHHWIGELAAAMKQFPGASTVARNDWLGIAVFITFIALLMLHNQLEHLFGLERDSMLVVTSLFMGGVVLLLRGERARQLIELRVDWWTLMFFMMLFAAVGALEQTGVTSIVARRMIISAGDRPPLLIQIIGWTTGMLSALLDNLLAVSTFLPIVDHIRRSVSGGYPQAVYWLLLFGGTLMGNATPIGSTSNIIACGLLEHRADVRIRFMNWVKIGVVISIASMMVATAALAIQTRGFKTPLMPHPAAQNP
ncbi:MAG: hypothetical protein JO353_13530, partial [Phycisphaerae bacterium]|nr:hypothetical protein [Phycisphaerae bacterium]